MSGLGGYPEGADFDERAPWHEKSVKTINVDVVINTTITKVKTIEVPENYKHEDLRKGVIDQINLPHEILNDWDLEDITVELL